jgi:predicted O-methyltransferase YrrM
MDDIRTAYPWPSERPDVPTDHHGWFTQSGHMKFLSQFMGPQVRQLVELGSWLGMSTRWFHQRCPNAMIYAVDHWEGSPENFKDAVASKKIPTLYETFLANSWSCQDRIVPVRERTLEGMAKLSSVPADLIYVDAAHDTESVFADVTTARKLWPEAVLCGDDWPHEPVKEGVRNALRMANIDGPEQEIITGGRCWAWRTVERS